MSVGKTGNDDHQQYDIPASSSSNQGNLDNLPDELIRSILSNLDNPLDLQSAALVKRRWTIESLNVARNEFLNIRNFCNFLTKKLDPQKYPQQINDIQVIAQDTRVLNSISVVDILTSYEPMKNKLITVLRQVDDKDFGTLQEKYKEYPLQSEASSDLLYAAKVFRNADEALAIPNDDQKFQALFQIVDGLCKDGRFALAIDVAKLMTNEVHKSQLIFHILVDLCEVEHFELAIDLVQLLKEPYLSGSIQRISAALGEKARDVEPEIIMNLVRRLPEENQDRALELITWLLLYYENEEGENFIDFNTLEKSFNFASSIKFRYTRNDSFYSFAKALGKKAKDVEPDEIIDYVGRMPKEVQDESLAIISWQLLSTEQNENGEDTIDFDNLKKSYWFALRIEDEGTGDESLYKLTQTLIRFNFLSDAVEVMDYIHSNEIHGKAINEMVDHLISIGKVDSAYDMAMQIRHELQKSIALKKIVQEYAKTRKFEVAMNVVPEIPNKELRDEAEVGLSQKMHEYVTELLSENKDNEALEVALQIPVLETRGAALAEIVSYLIAQGNIDDAIEVADRIIASDSQGKAFSEISHYYLKKGETSDALYFANKIPLLTHERRHRLFVDQRSLALSYIAKTILENGYSEKKDVDKDLLDEFLGIVKAIPHPSESDAMYSLLTEMLTKLGRNDEALTYIEKIVGLDAKNLALENFVVARVEKGLGKEEALDIINKILSKDKRYEHSSKMSALKRISIILVRQGKLADGMDLIASIYDSVRQRDAIFDLIKSLASVDDFKNGIIVAKRFKQDDALGVLAAKMAEKGDVPGGKQLANEISEDYHKGTALYNIDEIENGRTVNYPLWFTGEYF